MVMSLYRVRVGYWQLGICIGWGSDCRDMEWKGCGNDGIWVRGGWGGCKLQCTVR